MKSKVGVNDFGRLVLRASFVWDEFEFVQINEPFSEAGVMARLLSFDSVNGCWQHEPSSQKVNGEDSIFIDGQHLGL